MALVVFDRVKETSNTAGTGTIVLAGPANGYQSFAVVGNTNTTYYTIAEQTGADWEVGIGTYYSGNVSLARTTILASSNANAAVNFAGTLDVFVTYPAEDAVYGNGSVITAPSGALLPLTSGGTGANSAPYAMASLMGFTTTATAAGTTVFTNTSSYYQIFTGTSTQTITLPVTSTLATGWTFHICNNSTGNLTVNSSGGNLVITVLPGTTAMVTCILASGTTAASWEAGFTDFSTATGTGAVVLATSPTLVTPALGAATASSLAISAATGTASITSTTTGNARYILLNNSADSRNAYIYAPGYGLGVVQADANAASYVYLSTQNTERMRIDGAGNMGLGTTTLPNAGSPTERTFTISGTNYPQLYHIATAAAANNTTWRNIARNTAVYQLQLTNDAVTTEQTVYEVSRSASSVSYQRWFGGTTEALRITSAGGISFGSSGTAYGSAGQVLTSNGNAAPTWTDAAAKAWVRFNGGTGSPLTIVKNYNVSSVTRTNVGKYVVNMTNALADTAYSVVASSASTQSQGIFALPFYTAAGTTGTLTTTQFPILYLGTNGAPFDVDYCNLAVYD